VTAFSPAAQWVTAEPLWADAGSDPARMQGPALLRFSSDTFMADLAAQLVTKPEHLGDRVADARSYRPHPPGAPADWDSSLPEVKLYQAAHGHFNLVAASLICRMPGLPDRTLDLGEDEQAGFVLRRLVPDGATSFVESGWIDDPARGVKGWSATTAGAGRILPGEQLLPLFPVASGVDRSRRLFAGLIPTTSADTFKAAGTLSPFPAPEPPPTDPLLDPRMDPFDTRVIAPIDALRLATFVPKTVTKASEQAPFIKAGKDLSVEASRFILLDLAELLSTTIPTTWAAIRVGVAPSGAADLALYTLLDTATVEGSTVTAALRTAWEQRFRISGEDKEKPTLAKDLRVSTLVTETLKAALAKALPASKPAGEPPTAAEEAASEIPKLHPSGALFVVRCVYRRPKCPPDPLDVVGEPSERFTIASFFDPDAPARTIRVQLPVNTTLAELRKYPKNVGFALSNQLREQMTRVTDMKKTMDGELASGDSFDLGMLCSFSIPIITICALMVLMIFISLLNIVFWWAPLLRICLPITLPGKAE
jgi:hypothetical protein